ncbi:hypothetical protein BJ742DRAFT_765498 [Cladochytrium replicatum]|nr:hypothetical protein BJ742DRAFT_765498 [Cladochytrium replicatum]
MAATGRRYGTAFRNPTIPADFPTTLPVLELPSIGCPATGEWDVFVIAGQLFMNYGRCPAEYTEGDRLRQILRNTSPGGINRVFLLVRENRLALANVNVSVANSDNTDFVDVRNAEDTIIADLGKALMDHNGGGISKLPYFDPTSFIETADSLIRDYSIGSDNGRTWATTAVRLRSGLRDDIALVVAMPRSQFTQQIDQSKNRGTIIAVVFACLGSVLGVVLTLLAAWPLKKMARDMAKATMLDFSILEEGRFDESNMFIEIRNLQKTFNTMIKAL